MQSEEMQSAQQAERTVNPMAVRPMGSLLLRMSVPMMLSMLVQALYNVVDSVFVAQLSENALTAVSLAFPAQNLMIAVGVGTGVGVNALLSKSLGEGNHKRATGTAMNAVFLAACSYAVFALLGVLFSRAFFQTQTDIVEIVDMGEDYLRVCMIGSFGLFGQMTYEKLFQSTGRTFYSMLIQAIGALTNIVLDPILIFGLCGAPAMGVTGAAVATVAGQCLAALLGVIFNERKNVELKMHWRDFRPDPFLIGRIYAVGVPSIIMSSIGSVMTFGMNRILIAFSSTAAAVFGVYFKLQSFVFMPVFGLTNGMVPIVAFNFGARNPDRIDQAIRLSIRYAVIIMCMGLAMFEIWPDRLLALFNASENMYGIGVFALRIICIHFVFAGFSVVASAVFQALGHGVLSLIVSVARQLVVLLPAAFILSRIGGLNAVWWAFPIAEIASVVLCACFLRRVYRAEIHSLNGTPSPDGETTATQP